MGNELGFSEAWIGEHHTAPWEPHPSPDLLVAQALMQTRRMRIGPGGLLMPYCTWRAERETGRCRVPTVREGGRAENGCSVNRAFVPSMLDHTTTFGYDAVGSLTTITNPLGPQTTFTYNATGQPLSITTPTGTTTFAYDLGDLVSITDPTGNLTARFTNSVGRLVVLTNPLG